jgi:hypothetical protein
VTTTARLNLLCAESTNDLMADLVVAYRDAADHAARLGHHDDADTLRDAADKLAAALSAHPVFCWFSTA